MDGLYDNKRRPVQRTSGTTERSIRVVREQAVPHFGDLKRAWKDEKFSERELAYAATQPSQFRRTRTHLGGTADAHYAQEFRYWELREYARDMDRNDVIVGQMFDRALDNILGVGLRYNPNTGDKELDKVLKLRFQDWANDPKLCDHAWRRNFSDMARAAWRTVFVDGDSFVIPRGTAFQLFEGDRVASPDNLTDDVVHGIEVDPDTDRVLRYWFTKVQPGTRKQRTRRTPLALSSSDMVGVDAYSSDGRRQVLHLFEPSRLSQTRGVTALHAVFDYVGMFEDVNFARLVQQQVVSCIAAFITSERDIAWGAREEQSEADGSTTTLEELTPGLVHRLRPGESLESFSPNVPSPEFMHHVRLIVRLIGGCIGMPLELTMLDTTDTTFHGYRGVLQQARKGFERRQQLIVSCFHRPAVEHLLTEWSKTDLAMGRNKDLLRHNWTAPGWPYVDPKVDAQADKIRQSSCLASPRRIQAEQGTTWDDLSTEIVDDMGDAIEKALDRAEKLNEKYPDLDMPVTWREVLNLDNPAGNTKTVREQVGEAVAEGVQEGAAKAGQEKK